MDDLTVQRIIAAVKKGLPRDTAAKLARIAPSTLFDWLKRGREGDENYSEFADRVKAAEAEGEEELVGLIRDTARAGTWTAAAWLLERRRPKQYALRRFEQAPEVIAPEEAERLVAEAAKLAVSR